MSAERKVGRPKLADGRRKTVTLDTQTIEAGERLGHGNLSLGIRLALSPAQAPGPVSPTLQGASPDDTVLPAS